MIAQNDNYIQYFVQGDELDFEFINHRKETDTGLFTPKTYDDGVSYVSRIEAEANLILAVDKVQSAKAEEDIERIVRYVQYRISLCKWFLPLKKRKDFWAAVRAAKKPFYFKNEANKILLRLNKGENPRRLKQDIFNLHIPYEMKKELFDACDKQIRINSRHQFLKELIAA